MLRTAPVTLRTAPVMLRTAPVTLRTPPCHAARSRSIQKTTAEQLKPGVAGFRDWRAE